MANFIYLFAQIISLCLLITCCPSNPVIAILCGIAYHALHGQFVPVFLEWSVRNTVAYFWLYKFIIKSIYFSSFFWCNFEIKINAIFIGKTITVITIVAIILIKSGFIFWRFISTLSPFLMPVTLSFLKK